MISSNDWRKLSKKMRTYISAYLSKHAHSFKEEKSWLWFCAKRKPCLLALPSFFPYEPGNTTYSIKVLPFLDDKKSNKSFSYSRHGQNYEHFLLPFPAFSNQSCLLIQLFFPSYYLKVEPVLVKYIEELEKPQKKRKGRNQRKNSQLSNSSCEIGRSTVSWGQS